MKNLFALSAVLLAVSCCSIKEKLGCLAQDKMVEISSSVIVDKLQCKSPAQVKISMNAIFSKLNLCTQPAEQQTGLIGDLVCPKAADAVVNYIADGAIPAEWQCSASDAKAQLKDAFLQGCKKLVPVSKQ